MKTTLVTLVYTWTLATTLLAGATAAQAQGWKALKLLDSPTTGPRDEDRIVGIHCEAKDACIVATETFSDGGIIYAANSDATTAVLLDGKKAGKDAGGNELNFAGLTKTSAGLIARINGTTPLVMAAGDFQNPASWTLTAVGHMDGEKIVALNRQELFAVGPKGEWLYAYRGVVLGAKKAPSAGTNWAGLWSPTRRPPFPNDIDEKRRKDPTLCDSDIGGYIKPAPVQVAYAAPDLSMIVYPALAMNAGGKTDKAGVCVSTDGGKLFRNAPFPKDLIKDEYGPLAVSCTSKDHCVAYNGLNFDDDSPYVYVTNNASAGSKMTWAKATLNEIPNKMVQLTAAFFAPGGKVGFIVGTKDNKALVLKTKDAGLTWNNITDEVYPVTNAKLSTGFALDENNVWIGGEKSTLLYSATGGE